MDYLKTVVPSQLIAERGSNLVVINPGSANVRIGLAHQQAPFIVPQCIAWHMRGWDEGYQGPQMTIQDQPLNPQLTLSQHSEREKAYGNISSLLKVPFLDEDPMDSYPRKMGRVDGLGQQSSKGDTSLDWTDVRQTNLNSFSSKESMENKGAEGEHLGQPEGADNKERNSDEHKYREFICGGEAQRIPSSEPYCLRHPIRRGHLNISQHYPTQQVIEDLHRIWDWILNEMLHIPQADRNMFSVILVVPETFDSREIKEVLSIVLRDLRFGSAVVHQEGIAAIFGNGLSTACVVNLGAQVTSVICIDDGVALPTTIITLPFGGEDISRCLLWVQQRNQTWPALHTDPLAKPMDLLMLNKLKETYCRISGGELDAVAVVHSYEGGMPGVAYKTKMSALNVPPMGLFYPQILSPKEYPPPPRTWFNDYEDMLEDTWHMDFPRRPDMPDGFYLGVNGGVTMWETYPVFATKPKKEENLGLAEAITKSILSAGRIDLQRKLFCSIQLIGGVALTGGLVGVVEERVLHAIPANEAIDTVEVLQSRTDPNFVTWKGGAILGVLDFTRDGWIHREDWIHNGIHVGSGRKYKDSYYLQAQAMSYISS